MFELSEERVRARKSAGPRAALAAALLNGPFQRALDRCRLEVEIVAVETKPGLKPQTVARPKPDRQYICVRQQFPGKTFGGVRGHRNLKAVLAGIAGAGDEAVDAGKPPRTGVHEFHRLNFTIEFREHGFRSWSLQGDQRALTQRLDDADVGEMLLEKRLVLGLAGGVDHQKQMVAEIRHHQVVEN